MLELWFVWFKTYCLQLHKYCSTYANFFLFSLVASSDFPKVAVSCRDFGHINTMLCIRVSLPIINVDYLKENYEKKDMCE